MMRTREANLGDVAAVGALLHAALPQALSSPSGREDLPEGEVEAGRDVLESALAAGDLAWVLETGEQIAGVALARRRALARASHVGNITLIVHPLARRRGGGQLLLEALVAAARWHADFHKLAVRIASDDEAFRRTLTVSEPAPRGGWTRERVEAGALRRGALVLDMEVWGLDVSGGPIP